METSFSVEELERCSKWAKSSEGYIFFEWLKQELQRVTDGCERYIGAWEQEKIIKANKMLARQEEADYIQDFFFRLDEVIKVKKPHKGSLTTLAEL